jgi:hypothetical protein
MNLRVTRRFDPSESAGGFGPVESVGGVVPADLVGDPETAPFDRGPRSSGVGDSHQFTIE